MARRSAGKGLARGLGDPCTGPRSPLVDTTTSLTLDLSPSRIATREPLETPSKSPPLPPRSPLRPPPRSLTSTTVHPMPPPMLRMGSSSAFSVNTLVDYPTADIVIDGHFLKPKVPPLLAVPRTPSPDKPLPITPSSTSSSPTSTLTGGSSPDCDSPRDPIDSPPPLPLHNLRCSLAAAPSAPTPSSSSSSLSVLMPQISR
jgi:hypothetical protein